MPGCRTVRLALATVGILIAVPMLPHPKAALHAAQEPWTAVFEKAEFTLSEGRVPPGESAAWLPVSLPDEWRHRLPANFRGIGWYRIQFVLPRDPAGGFAIGLPQRRAHRMDVFVNEKLLASSSDLSARGGTPANESRADSMSIGTPEFLIVPPSLLNAGANVLHVRLRASSAPFAMHGLSRVTFGDARPVRKAYVAGLEVGLLAQRNFLAMAFATGLITLFLWLARRGDRVMLWFTIALLSWAIAGIPRIYLRYADLPLLNGLASTFVNYGLVVPAVVLCLRTVDLKWPRFEAALWGYFLVMLTHPVWSDGGNTFVRLGWDAVNTAILLAGVGVILYTARKPLRWPVKLEVAALFLMAVLMFSELARYLGWIPIETPVIRHYHVPVMLLAIGAAVFERHVFAVWRIEQTNLELERRVAEKAREIEAFHGEREKVMREQALARERQRIFTDMHDGVGASLVALLRYAQSRQSDPHIEQSVKEALQELRISIDALEPSEGDLGVVLGNLRYRLEPLLDPAGVRLEWEVMELPQIEALEPTAVFALQRIVLEAVANSLKHSGASHIRLAARAAPGGVEIRIEDNGRGFDPSHSPAHGAGLRNMRARAERFGVQIEVSSRTGSGTTVRLLIPRQLPRITEDQASEVPDPRAAHDLAPATGAAA